MPRLHFAFRLLALLAGVLDGIDRFAQQSPRPRGRFAGLAQRLAGGRDARLRHHAEPELAPAAVRGREPEHPGRRACASSWNSDRQSTPVDDIRARRLHLARRQPLDAGFRSQSASVLNPRPFHQLVTRQGALRDNGSALIGVSRRKKARQINGLRTLRCTALHWRHQE
jgi:hypothetical protein